MKTTLDNVAGYTPAQQQLVLAELHKKDLPDVVEDFSTIVHTVLGTADSLDKKEINALFRVYNLKCRFQELLKA